MSEHRFAPDGSVWVCRACGKTTRDRYRADGGHSPGWDESCMLNAVLCSEASIIRNESGRIIHAEATKARAVFAQTGEGGS